MLSKSFKYCLDSLENETYCAHLVVLIGLL